MFKTTIKASRFAICAALVTFLLPITFADLRYRGNAVHPDYPGQCYYEELKQPISTTQFFKPVNTKDQCVSIYCRPDYVLELEYCGRHNMIPTDTCQIVSDMRHPYPECCPKMVCQPDSNFI